MFATQESTPWYRSLTGLIVASILLPPVGIVLLWTRRRGAVVTKILATLCILALGAGYFFAFTQWRKRSRDDAHYAALEQHRAQQQQASQPVGQPTVTSAQPAAPTASAARCAGSSPCRP